MTEKAIKTDKYTVAGTSVGDFSLLLTVEGLRDLIKNMGDGDRIRFRKVTEKKIIFKGVELPITKEMPFYLWSHIKRRDGK